MSKQIILNAFNMNCVAHQSSGLWRHPRDRSREYYSLKHWLDLARTLERGLFDGLFLADVSGVYDVYKGSPDPAISTALQIPANDPFCLVSGMASVTEHLSFGITGSIPYEPPYSFARRMSTLDHLTKGRVAWNIVTGYLDSAARGVGQKKQEKHDTRYEIAEDYMQAVYKLWEGSWEDGAVIYDKEAGVFANPAKVHNISHQGAYFAVEGVHLCEPSVQRTPVLFQAGSSPKGQAFAAKHAECVFLGTSNRNAAAILSNSLRDQAEAEGRQRDDLKLFPPVCLILGETDAAAEAKHAEYRQYGLNEGAFTLLSGWSGIDLSTFRSDQKVENVQSEAIQGAMNLMGAKTVEEWGELLCVGGAGGVITGSPSTVADELELWMETADVDGFNLAYTVLPECYEDVVDLLVPELQRRCIYKKEYEPGSIRKKLFGHSDRLGSNHPGSHHRKTLGA